VKFGTNTHHLYGLLELVHVDVWGPTKTVSLGGHRYFVLVVDYYFGRCWVYPIRQRVEALELLVKWKELMKNQTSKKSRCSGMIILRSSRILSCNLARTMVLLPTSQMEKIV